MQVRRSSYHDVVRAQDVAKLADVSGIQAYTINGARWVLAIGSTGIARMLEYTDQLNVRLNPAVVIGTIYWTSSWLCQSRAIATRLS